MKKFDNKSNLRMEKKARVNVKVTNFNISIQRADACMHY
jgi:hypothetical protein